jgi:hypothetical protein
MTWRMGNLYCRYVNLHYFRSKTSANVFEIFYFSCVEYHFLFYFQIPFYPPQQMFEDFSAKVI